MQAVPYSNNDGDLSIRNRIDNLRLAIDAAVSKAKPPPSRGTIRQYAACWNRMRRRRLAPEDIAPNSRKSYNLYRSSLLYVIVLHLKKAKQFLDQYDLGRDNKLNSDRLDLIDNCLGLLKRYPPNERNRPSRWKRPDAGVVRKGKRRGLAKLPDNWRYVTMIAGLDSTEFCDATMLTAFTAIRPAELAKGARVHATLTGIKVTILGAKVTQHSGQPERQIWLRADNLLLENLQTRAALAGDMGLEISIRDPREFCDYLRKVSKQHFPDVKYTVTPYSFRHMMAADQKASGVSHEVLAITLGHLSALSQQDYGAAGQSGAALVHVEAVAASRAVHVMPGFQNKPWQRNAMQLRPPRGQRDPNTTINSEPLEDSVGPCARGVNQQGLRSFVVQPYDAGPSVPYETQRRFNTFGM